MRLIRIIALIGLTIISAAPSALAQVAKSFVDAPQDVFPLLDRTTRLDMIDYYNSNMSTPSNNQLGGKSRITDLTPQKLSVEMTGASDYQLALLGTNNDSVLMVITTVKTPAPDSRVDFYKKDWTKLNTTGLFKKPSLNEWLSDDGRDNIDDVNTFLPFLLVSYDYNPAVGTLTLTNNTSEFLSQDIYSMMSGYLKDRLIFKWNGKEFRLVD